MRCKGTKKGVVSYYECIPKELIELCLGCVMPDCKGNCETYSALSRELLDRRPVNKRGVKPKPHVFRGYTVTAIDMSRILQLDKNTVYRKLREGLSMEEIYELYESGTDERRNRKSKRKAQVHALRV